MSELKPCPTCESLNIGRVSSQVYEMCGIEPDYLCRDCATKASAHRWNTRPIEQQQSETIDKLVEALENLVELNESCEGLAGINGTQYIIAPNELTAFVDATELLATIKGK